MKFTDTLLKLVNEKGITKNKLMTDLEFGSGTFATWESRGTIPSGEILAKIADYFNVSIDYLMGREKPLTQFQPLSEEDYSFVMKCLKLKPEHKGYIMGRVDAYLEEYGEEAIGKGA